MKLDPDTLDRTLKIELDDGAESLEEAVARARKYVLQVSVGAGVANSRTRQAMLLTILNAGKRAFFGGVRMAAAEDFELSIPWAAGRRLEDVAREHGADLVSELSAERPAVHVGHGSAGPSTVYPTWEGWAAGVVCDPAARLAESAEFELAGMLAGAFAVSELFQRFRGYAPAADRDAGLSLWRPDADWRDAEASGERLRFLPDRLWLLGLGHLGQAYGWALGLLPYPEPGAVTIALQDFDRIVDANQSTGLLSGAADVGRRKTRVVAERLEALGFETLLVERQFDERLRRTGDEPGLALAGFDKPEPRRALERAGFDLVVDAGLGRGPRDYLEILVHRFPSGLTAADAFRSPGARGAPGALELDLPAYERLVEELAADGSLTTAAARCGVLEIAGRSVGAAFVGTVAAALVLSEPLRILHGGQSLQVIDLSLRSPEHVMAVPNEAPRVINPGFARL